MLRLMNNRPDDWPIRLPAALQAYRMATSDVTGFSPFYLLYGRQVRPPCGVGPPLEGQLFGNRLDELAEARRVAAKSIEESRRYNRARLEKRANVDVSLRVGEEVAVKAEERITGTAHWDPGYIVTRVRGTTHWVNNPETGSNKRLHREKLKVMTGIEGLDEIRDRPHRQFRKRNNRQ
jgi:hypothetical protein